MILITQRQAILRLRDIGLSEATATEKVRAMSKTRDGAREKVSRYQVELVIAEYEHPRPEPKVSGIKPLSAHKVAKIRAFSLREVA